MHAYFIKQLIYHFLQAFGVVLGAAMLGGIAAILTLESPKLHMESIADKIKIWAVVAAIGGTIDPFRLIETNFSDSQYMLAIKQILLIISAFIGASMGTRLIQWVCSGGGEG